MEPQKENQAWWKPLARKASEWAQRAKAPQDPKEEELLLQMKADAFWRKAMEAAQGEQSAKARKELAAELALELRSGSEQAIGEMLVALSAGLGPQHEQAREAIESIEWDDVDTSRMEALARKALRRPRKELVRLWLSMEGALEFLVWLRAQTLARLREMPELEPLEIELKETLAMVFAQGLLSMRRVSWRSPAAQLEKVMRYESVHAMRSWDDLKSRLDGDRRVYAFFHDGWDDEPLAFLEVALTKGISRDVVALLGQSEPIDPSKADTAMFYSINAPHAGLKGISFGEDLIRQAVQDLAQTLPGVKKHCTISPIPTFARWLSSLSEKEIERRAGSELVERWAKKGESLGSLKDLLVEGWHLDAKKRERIKEPLMRLAASYLAGSPEEREPKDPVARFHLGNGARIEAMLFLADTSAKGMAQSHGMMVNYFYELSSMEKNRATLQGGKRAASRGVRKLAAAKEQGGS